VGFLCVNKFYTNRAYRKLGDEPQTMNLIGNAYIHNPAPPAEQLITVVWAKAAGKQAAARLPVIHSTFPNASAPAESSQSCLPPAPTMNLSLSSTFFFFEPLQRDARCVDASMRVFLPPTLPPSPSNPSSSSWKCNNQLMFILPSAHRGPGRGGGAQPTYDNCSCLVAPGFGLFGFWDMLTTSGCYFVGPACP
jgi:hypothetical protein